MNVTEPFVLKKDVVLIPCADLSDDARGRITFDEGDYTLSRRHGRALAQVVDAEIAALLTIFREPHTIIDAVVENGLALGKDLNAWLDELLPHIGTFLQHGVLVPVGSEEDAEIRPRFDAGAGFRGWEIVRCVSLIEDCEVYQLRGESGVAALKICRMAIPLEGSLYENEAAILRHLDGSSIAPRLIESGVDDGRPFLIVDWIAGVEAGVAAAQRRHDRAALIEICASVAAAYAALHARGVVHSDVHPRNILVDENGNVTLLDFGFSRLADRAPRVGRGGMYYFFEPEYLAAQRHGVMLPSSPAGEQYAVAALLYLLASGHHYLDFQYDREEMARQAENDPPLPFAKRGIPPWPALERILIRALEKDPAQRYASMSELAALLSGAHDDAVRESMSAPLTDEANALLAATLQSFARGGTMFAARYPKAPTASINFGTAGAAVALLRIAEARGDPALLALADVWASRALALAGSSDAFYNAEDGSPRELLGDVTPYHTESGVHAAAALVAAARGNVQSQSRAVSAFLAASNRPCKELDLTLGRSGSLLGAALLLEVSGDLAEAAALRAFGTATMSEIWSELDARPPLGTSPETSFMAMAHGWSGYLYAALRWCAASGNAVPPRVVERLHECAALQTPSGRGASWTADNPAQPMWGWCRGSAGAIFLWTLAHTLLGGDDWLRLAELAAWDTWDVPRGIADLCCGSSGRAYALLNFYKHTGDVAWLSRARQLANHAASAATATAYRPNALWKGELGVAVLIADLASPETARMPFFE